MNSSHAEAELSFDTAYQDAEDMYGMPYQELQDYFKGQPTKCAVLDLGCGQGRDALFLASIGYEVTALDSSEVGVKQMLKKAETQNLQIEGIVADVLDAKIDKKFDVVLFDMILHSFERPQQIELLKKYSDKLTQNGMVCIVFPDDIETSHFMKLLNSLSQQWELKDEILVRDIPKINDDEIDFTFVMICVQHSV